MRSTRYGRCLALLLLLGTYVTHAQKADAEPGLRRLKRNNGLCGIKFGTPKQRIHHLDSVGIYGTGFFEYCGRPREYHKLGQYKVRVSQYGFTKRNGTEVLSSMILRVSDTAAYDKVAQLLQARYGPSTGSLSRIWKSSTVYLTYRVYKYSGGSSYGRIRVFREDWNTLHRWQPR